MARALLISVFGVLLVVGFAFYTAYWRWCLPRRWRSEQQRLRSEEAAGIPPSPRDYQYAVSFDAVGFSVADLRRRDCKPVEMRWEDVRRATAFKRDLFSVDCICLIIFD